MAYKKNISLLIFGNTIAQAIPVIVSPLLTRIYSPEDFGVFGLYLSVVAISSSFINGQYHVAIVLPVDNDKAAHLAALSLFFTIILTIILFLVIILFNDFLVGLLKNKNIGQWLYFVPISFFALGVFNVFNYLNTRYKHYDVISNSNIYRSVTMSLFQFCIGFFKKDPFGLLIGSISGIFISILYFRRKTKYKIFKKITLSTLIEVMRQYQDFPKINTLNNLLYNSTQNSMNIVISIIFNLKFLGYYALIQRVLMLPITIVGSAVSQVFFQKINDSKRSGDDFKDFIYTLRLLLIGSIPLFTVLYFIIDDVFAIVFGEEWREAGYYAKILIPLFFMNFLRSSLNTVTITYRRQKTQMVINFLMLFTIVAMAASAKIMKYEFKEFLFTYTVSLFVFNVAILIYYYYLVKHNTLAVNK